jgi:hypothetical protein
VSLIEPAPSVDFAKVTAVAKSFPNFTLQQHRAIMSELVKKVVTAPVGNSDRLARTAR